MDVRDAISKTAATTHLVNIKVLRESGVRSSMAPKPHPFSFDGEREDGGAGDVIEYSMCSMTKDLLVVLRESN